MENYKNDIKNIDVTAKSSVGQLDIIDSMFLRWNSKWPKFMSFDQNVFWYKNEGVVKQSVWNEILSSPENLQIRFDGFESGDGVIFEGDTAHFFEKGELVKSEFKINQALLLGFDVYNQDPSITKKKIQQLGIDLSKFHEVVDEEGEVHLVFGTSDKQDITSPQFWIHKKELYLTRIITVTDKHTDIYFKNYQMISDFPVATKIVFIINKELYMIEEYYNIKFPTRIDEDIFLLDKFKSTRW